MSTAVAHHDEMVTPVYVWQIPVRATHWAIVLSIFVLSVTGYFIGRPALTVSGEAEQHFVMGWMRTVHFYAATVFTLSAIARFYWLFAGNRWARWNQFLPVTKERWKGVIKTLMFYTFIKPAPPEGAGHNPMAGIAYLGIFSLYIVLILTGFGMYAAGATIGSPMHPFAFFVNFFGGPEYARWIHHGLMWVLLMFMIQHVYSSILVSQLEHHGELDSIFSGWKFLPTRLKDHD